MNGRGGWHVGFVLLVTEGSALTSFDEVAEF